MIVPRFTVRSLLLLMTVCSVFFLVLATAIRGQLWAIAVSAAVGSAVLAFLCYGAFFGVAYLLASVFGLVRRETHAGTPFATAAPPPQLIPPEEPET